MRTCEALQEEGSGNYVNRKKLLNAIESVLELSRYTGTLESSKQIFLLASCMRYLVAGVDDGKKTLLVLEIANGLSVVRNLLKVSRHLIKPQQS